MPFYLYGTPKDLNIDHILVRSPNIQLSADNIQLSLAQSLPPDVLAKGAILTINGISEAAMQPFQSTEGSLGDTLTADSNFFFRPGQEFSVAVYEDPRAAVRMTSKDTSLYDTSLDQRYCLFQLNEYPLIFQIIQGMLGFGIVDMQKMKLLGEGMMKL